MPDRQDAVEARAGSIGACIRHPSGEASAPMRSIGLLVRDLRSRCCRATRAARQLVGEIHLRGGAQLAGACVQAREQSVRSAGDGRRVLHHAGVDLVQVERGGHRRRCALQPELVAGALASVSSRLRSLERHRREVGEPFDHR